MLESNVPVDCDNISETYNAQKPFCYQYRLYTCEKRHLDEYDVSCVDTKGKSIYMTSAANTDVPMKPSPIKLQGELFPRYEIDTNRLTCDSPVFTDETNQYFDSSSSEYSCYKLTDYAGALSQCGYAKDCYLYKPQKCTRTLKSGSTGPTLPKREYSLDCVPVTGEKEWKDVKDVSDCTSMSNQNRVGQFECYALYEDGDCYLGASLVPYACHYIKYICNRTLDSAPVSKPSNGCSEGDVCCEIFGKSLISKIKTNILKPLRIIAPILLLVLTTVDFAKIVFSENNKDGMPKAWKNFLKRAIATLIIFFASNIVSIIYGFIQGGVFCPFG